MNDKSLGTRRQQILSLLKKKKGMTAQELAQETAISGVGVRQHLTVLERDGLVAREEVNMPGRGRPKIVYRPTQAADRLFPQTSNDLLLQMVEHVRQTHGDQTIDRFFAARLAQQKEEYLQRMKGLSFEEKVKELARIRDESGYMAEAETEGGAMLLTEHHCPIFQVAQNYPQACRYEMELFCEVLGVDLQRDKHLPCGDGMCRYRMALPKKQSRKR
jgi:predicted ArsR family transcriptional regulator